MKYSAGILAVALVSTGVSAFVGPVPKVSVDTSLYSTPSFNGDGIASRRPISVDSRGVEVPDDSPSASMRRGRGSYQSGPINMRFVRSVWESLFPVTVQGGSLRTCSFANPEVERVQVLLKTDGRPLNANVELWQGPDNTPQKMGVYIEDGDMRPFNCVIETPGGANAVAIRNTGHMEFPMKACVEADVGDYASDSNSLGSVTKTLYKNSNPRTIQGGAIHTYPFPPEVQSVQVLLRTDGRPLNARIELMQGPNNNKQVMEIYSEDGLERPFFCIIETPGVGNVVRIVNTATMEFPISGVVEPYLVGSSEDESMGRWDSGGSNFMSNASPNNFFFLGRDN